MVNRVQQDQLERQVLSAVLDKMEILARRDHKDKVAQTVVPAPPELREIQADQDQVEHRESKDPKDYPEQLVLLDHKELRVILDKPAAWDK